MTHLQNLSIRKKLSLLAIVLLAASALVGATSYQGLSTGSARVSDLAETQLPALRSMMTADMMHDALRAVAFRAIIAAQTDNIAEKQQSREELEEFSKKFRESIQELDALSLPAEVGMAISEVKPELEAFLRETEHIVSQAVEVGPVAARAGLPEFQARFHRLEGGLEKLGDQIEAHAKSAMEESVVSAKAATQLSGALLVLALLVGIVLSALISRDIIHRLEALSRVMDRLAAGELDARAEITGSDEIAMLADAINRTLTGLDDKVKRLLEVVAAGAEGDLTREVTVLGDDPLGRMGRGVAKLCASLRQSIGIITDNCESLAKASSSFACYSREILEDARATSGRASTASTAANQIGSSVTTVATATEEMHASIKEIASSATSATRIATSAVQMAAETGNRVNRLSESSTSIGGMVKVISSIAQQTNLLALNATIEAARAGAAGRGFAVVANEVKDLASETAKATTEISQVIEGIQGDIAATISAIGQFTQIVHQIHDIQTTIAGAVEEQTATANEIARNIHEAATGGLEIARHVDSVARSAEGTVSRLAGIEAEVTRLNDTVATLSQLVGRFRLEASGRVVTSSPHKARLEGQPVDAWYQDRQPAAHAA